MDIPQKKEKAPKFTVEHFRQVAALKPYQSMLEVGDKDPDFQYRLVENTPEAIRYREQLGYLVVTDSDETVEGAVGQPDRRRLIAGELVVMRRPKELAEMHEQVLKERSMAMQRGPIERFKGKAQRLGVEVVDETKMMVSPLSQVMGGDAGDDEDDD